MFGYTNDFVEKIVKTNIFNIAFVASCLTLMPEIAASRSTPVTVVNDINSPVPVVNLADSNCNLRYKFVGFSDDTMDGKGAYLPDTQHVKALMGRMQECVAAKKLQKLPNYLQI